MKHFSFPAAEGLDGRGGAEHGKEKRDERSL